MKIKQRKEHFELLSKQLDKKADKLTIVEMSLKRSKVYKHCKLDGNMLRKGCALYYLAVIFFYIQITGEVVMANSLKACG